MKILKVFSLVVVLHMVLLVMLVFQPGCKTVSKTETAKADKPIGDSRYSDLWVMNGKDSKKSKSTKSSPVVTNRDNVKSSVAYSETPNNDNFIDMREARVQTAAVYTDDNNHGEYAVEKGDSLWKIARKNNISMRTLMSYNGLTETDRIFPGQVLMIPGGSGEVAPASTKPIAEPTFIAKKETPVVEEPVVTEKVETMVAKVDIPQSEGAEGVYEVQPGDSLYIIAVQNNTSVEEIRKLNNLDKYMIRIGQKIRIPGKYNGATETPLSPEKKSFAVAFNDVPVENVATGDGEYLEHEVKAGEFPGLIARKYNMNVADLLRINNIQNPRALRVGTTLKVVNPEFMINQTDLASAPSQKTDTESVAVKIEDKNKKMEDDTSVSTINFEDFPIVRVGS